MARDLERHDARPAIPRKEPEPVRRLYFALWPDEVMRAELACATRLAVQGGNGQPVPPRNYHITLAFLGSVPERQLEALIGVARQVAETCGRTISSIEMTLDRIEHWRRPQILCATPTERTRAADYLAGTLEQALVSAGFAPDLKPFRPHVTLARKVSRASGELSMRSVASKFDGFALVESRTEATGASYSIVDFQKLDTG